MSLPVSYTHLDVYKRQVWAWAVCHQPHKKTSVNAVKRLIALFIVPPAFLLDVDRLVDYGNTPEALRADA